MLRLAAARCLLTAGDRAAVAVLVELLDTEQSATVDDEDRDLARSGAHDLLVELAGTDHGTTSAEWRTWYSMSNSVSSVHTHWPAVVSERCGRLMNRGATSSTSSIERYISRTYSRPAPSGLRKSCSPPTCMGCARFSASRNAAEGGSIGTAIATPFVCRRILAPSWSTPQGRASQRVRGRALGLPHWRVT